ncbi:MULTISPECIES: hypothetical protein [unclassified Streptomyces]|uniref:hypothetical protein n=1 Tax=unclassified Streptomyces TaxID=2593676 RepID=UPI00380B0FAA
MSPKRERPVVPAASPLARKPVTPVVESLMPQQPTGDQASEVPDSWISGVTDSGSSVLPESVTPGTVGGEHGPRWKDLERKETRLRADQIEALTALRRRVSAQRRNRSEIITDNTLIRIAVDVLLMRADQLKGDTEADLLTSLVSRQRARK